MSRKTRAPAPIVVLMLVWVVVVVALTAGCGGAGTPLKYQLKAGQSYTYDLAMTLKGNASGLGITADEGVIPSDSTVKARMTISVTEVKDGVATIVHHYEDAQATSQGQTETLPAASVPDTTMKIDEQGRILSVASGGTSLPFSVGGVFDYSQLANLTGVIFPQDGSAKPGEEWNSTFKFPLPGLSQDVSATSKGRLVSVSEEGGRRLAKVDFSVNVPVDTTLDLGELVKELGLAATLPTDVDVGTLAFKMTIKGAESVSGNAQVDVGTGVAAVFDGTVVMKMSMEISDAPADLVPADQRGPFSMDLTAEVKLTEVR